MKTQIVVVGGGAGGLELVRKLGAKLGNKEFDIILVERERTHIWKPLLHEVAAGALDANQDEVGYRHHAYRWRYRFYFGEMAGVDREKKEVVIAPVFDPDGEEVASEHRIRYDYLVIAIGSISNDFGVHGVDRVCHFLDNRGQADVFRQRLLNQCVRVARTLTSEPNADSYVEVVIVGAGATGVELSAELFNAAAGLRYYGLEVFDDSRLKVTLIEAGERILPALPEELSQSVTDELEKLGVCVRTNTTVVSVDKTGVETGNGDRIPANLIVWSAGIKAPKLLTEIPGLETNKTNQLIVRPTLQTTADERIFALGDCASYTPEGSDRPIPPRAQAAHQMADVVLANLLALVRGEEQLKPFKYHDHGLLVSLSGYQTVGSLMGAIVGGRMAVAGRVARFVYVSLYRMHLLAIHGYLKGSFLIALGHVNKVVRPRLKLH